MRYLLLCLTLMLSYAVTSAQEQTKVPPVFIDADYEINCSMLVREVNVTRAIGITQNKFELQNARDWWDSGMGHVDDFHAGMTQTVHVFSASADCRLASWAGDENATKPARGTPRDGNISAGMSDYFNRLFLNDDFLSSTESSYLLISLGLETNKMKGPSFLNKVKFALSLPLTQRHLQLFVGDPLNDEDKGVVDEEGNVDQETAVGARYFMPEFFDDFKTSVSAGLRGIANPFVQARLEYPVNYYDWLIRPVQYFDYSLEREFYEESRLYFDRRISRTEMVRLLLKRTTQTQKVGMKYTAQISYLNTLKRGVGFRTYVSMTGNTELDEARYEDPPYRDVDPHAGVYLYSVGGSWKQSFLRRWLFYEIGPRVDFDMLYAWRPNYVVRYWIDIYFGDT